jgi:hypothetical protein
MTATTTSTSRLGLRIAYGLSLLLLCLYMVMAPAAAVNISCNVFSPVILSPYQYGSVTAGTGTLDSGTFTSPNPYYAAIENVTFACDSGSSQRCAAAVYFGFWGYNYNPSNPFQFNVHLTGSSTDPYASGTLELNNGLGSANWWVNSGNLIMDRLSFLLGTQTWNVSGTFYINSLAPGTSVSWGTTSLDFNTQPYDADYPGDSPPPSAPEPGTAAVVIAGFAWVEFLRRKLRKRA